MRTALLIATTCLLMNGCEPPPFKPTKPSKETGGVIGDILDKPRQVVTMEMMRDLYLYMYQEEVAGQMPSKEVVFAYAKKENPRLWQLLDSGAIVLTGAKTRDGVWAYEKDAPTKGGWVIIAIGQSKMSPEEVQKLLGK
jgi:hypothetical protein